MNPSSSFKMSDTLNKSKCYFCKKEMPDASSLQSHMAICGSVLEPCPNACGCYTQRSLRNKHLQECLNAKRPSQARAVPDNGTMLRNATSSRRITPNRMSVDVNQIAQISVAAEISSLSKKLSVVEQNCYKLMESLNSLHNKNQEYAQINQNNLLITKAEFEKLHVQNRLFFEWRKVLDSEMDKIATAINIMKQYKVDIDNISGDLQKSFRTINYLENDNETQKQQFMKEQTLVKQQFQTFADKLNEFRDFMTQENATIGSLWTDQNVKLEIMQKQINDLKAFVNEKANMHEKLVFDVRAVTQVSSEASEKLEIQERKFNELTQTLKQFKLDFEILEDNQARISNTINPPGHLIWKITDFTMKMENAKENNTVLKSPIFYSHQYGYKIRLLVYLNGIKKWKGRHTIACIHVLNGDYDLLLRWPCNMEGTIALKDIQSKSQDKDYKKTISAKRNCGDEENDDPQESSTQYIFIPHTTLTKPSFIQEDTLFLEVKITNPSKSLSETNL